MEYIKILEDEKLICNNSDGKKRKNSDKYDYANKIYKKPWGSEYLAYQNTEIGIWILKINKGMETSVHCHFKKDTILICLSGSFKIKLYDSFKILNILECLYIPREVFHGIHAYSDDSILMEIEIYTDTITYTDKNDLLRLRDVFNRDKNCYESSITEILSCNNIKDLSKYLVCSDSINVLNCKAASEL